MSESKSARIEGVADLQQILHAVPGAVFLVDENLCIEAANRAAVALEEAPPEAFLSKACGEVLACVHAGEESDGCGRGLPCRDCAIRIAVDECFSSGSVVRRPVRFVVNRGGRRRQTPFIITVTPLEAEGPRRAVLVLEDASPIVELQSLLPICCYCKKIRRDDDYWEKLEVYLHDNLDLTFSHGICPDCMAIATQEDAGE